MSFYATDMINYITDTKRDEYCNNNVLTQMGTTLIALHGIESQAVYTLAFDHLDIMAERIFYGIK